MILTTCAACAAPLAHDAPRCIRCKIRYCDQTCQHDHWRRGHKQMCKKIHRGGNAKQYYADKKYKEAVAEAVEACADDTKGQTCFICTQALHWKTKEGLVRGCSCRGTAGLVHVSCLAEQAKILWSDSNYARFLKKHEEYDKAKSLHRRTIPMARRALGDSNDITLRMRWLYANCLCDYKNATLDDLVEAVETLEAVAKLWKRVKGERHPETPAVLEALKVAREKLRLRRAAREVASD